jgi:hypothetical protein
VGWLLISEVSPAPEYHCNCALHLQLEAAAEDFWRTPKGITMRIDGLAQDLHFFEVNCAFKMVAPTNHISWMRWVTAEDDRVCQKCIEKSQGGNGNGYYKVSWFLPKMPIHKFDRCQWELIMGEFTL